MAFWEPALLLISCVVLVRPLNTPLCLTLPLCKMVIKKKREPVGQRREGVQVGDHGGEGLGMKAGVPGNSSGWWD